MQVKILELSSSQLMDAIIKEGEGEKLPSIRDNWVFNFDKYSKLPKAKAYILVNADTENKIEGCMIFSNKGILTFVASSGNAALTKRLEDLYRKKYGAVKNPFGFMEIYQDQSKRLMEEYLYREGG